VENYRQGNYHTDLEIKMETDPDGKTIHETMQREFRCAVKIPRAMTLVFPGVTGADFFSLPANAPAYKGIINPGR